MKLNFKQGVKHVLSSLWKAIRNHQGTITVASLAALFVYYLLSGDNPGDPAMAVVLGGIGAGSSVIEEPVTIENTPEAEPELLRPAIDSRVVKIRPASTPLDQISRCAGSRPIGSMRAEYYSVDVKPFSDVTTAALDSGLGPKILQVKERARFSVSDTLLLPDVEVTDSGGNTSKGLVLYVAAADRSGLTVLPVNNYQGSQKSMPSVAAGAAVIRMGRAAAELDVQTDQYEALPTKAFNYCQIFKAQIEQSTLMKLSNKEVRWSLNDMEESAIVDMRMAMEKSFLFGHRAKIENPETGQAVYLTGGVWNQAGKQFDYSTLTDPDLVDLCRSAFTGQGGSPRKVLIGGSALISALNKLSYSRVATGRDTQVVWGIDFSRIVTHFGTLYVAMSEIFDQCGRPADGMIIDPAYIVKYSHVPFTADRLDLRRSGQRNTEAVVLTEASCLVLRYPQAHMRIVGPKA